MLRTIPIPLLSLWVVSALAESDSALQPLWRIGEPDNRTSEFALAPADYSGFTGPFGDPDDLYFIGHSTPKEHWKLELA